MFTTILANVVAWVTSKLGGAFVDKFLGYLKHRTDNEIRRLEIQSAQEQNANNNETKLAMKRSGDQVTLLTSAMRYKAFWVPWLMCAIPVGAWFGWGMLDSLFNGALPDVAALPPQLKHYADIVFQNIFWTGGAGVGATAIDNAARNITAAILRAKK